ncbi:MAG: hypothetical protein ACI9J2_000114 [Saprospiraceae bacterium]|jgi:hypothetical protein
MASRASKVSFITFVSYLSEQIKGHRFSIDPQAKELNQLFDPNTIHYRLSRQVIVDIYQTHQLQNLNQIVEPYKVLDSLGIIRGKLLDSNGDIDQINLIDLIGELTVQYFELEPLAVPAPKKQAKVIPFTRRE